MLFSICSKNDQLFQNLHHSDVQLQIGSFNLSRSYLIDFSKPSLRDNLDQIPSYFESFLDKS